MAGRVRDAKLDSATARAKLLARGKPYYRALGQGLHLGYRKGRSEGKWVARVYNAATTAYAVETIATADDRAEADGNNVLSFYQAQERARARYEQLTGQGEAYGPYTVEAALADYVSRLEQLGKPTADTRNRISVHILPNLGKVKVAKLTAKQIRDWMKELADQPPRVRGKPGSSVVSYRVTANDEEAKRRRRASSNRTLTVLKAALNLAWREGKAASDKEWRKVQPFEKADAARMRYLQVTEAQRLINACEPGFRELVQAALQTGCRYGELCRLQVQDFNRDAGTLSIRVSKSGKPRHVILTEEGAALFEQLSAGKRGSDLLLPNQARLSRSEARAQLERERRLKRGDKTSVARDDDGEWRASEQVRAMAEACKRAKIDPSLGFHALRHTWASLAVMGGTPLMVVARNLGHTDTRMVEKHYGHLSQTYLEDAIRKGAPRFGCVEPSNVRSL